MKTKLRSAFSLQPLAFALLALLTASPSARAQTSWGSALSFDGVDDYVSATIPALTSNYTVSAWAFLRSGGSYSGDRVALLSTLNCGESAEILIHSGSADDTVGQMLDLGRCSKFDGGWSVQQLPLGRWVHLAVTVSSNRHVRYFINGIDAEGSWNAGTKDITIGPNIVLGNNATRGRKFDGLLDEVQIWNKERTQTEIQADMNHPLIGTEPNLLAYWKFDEGAGTSAADATTHGFNGLLVHSPIWTDSTLPKAGLGNAVSFDGVNDYIVIPNFGGTVPTNEVTVEFWQRAHQAKEQSTFGVFPSHPTNRFQAHVTYDAGQVFWDCGDITGAGRLWYTPAVPLVGTWQHFALVAKAGPGGFMAIYRNGVKEAYKAGAGSPCFSTQELRLGVADSTYFFDGDLDEFRIWKVARTQAEIQANMCHPLTGAEANLLAYYRLNEGTGLTVHDATTNGFNGVLVNGTSWTNSTTPQARGWGNALSFNGTGLINANIPKLWINWTFSAWIYLYSGGNNQGGRSALGVLSAACGQSAEVVVNSESHSSTDPQYLWFGRCSRFTAAHSTQTVPLNRWVHVAVTVSSNRYVRYFINGSAAGSWDASGWASDVQIGPAITLADNVTRSFYGMLDEVQIWDTARTQAQIASDMACPLTGRDPNLVAYYRFDEAAGTLAYDAASYQHNGTFTAPAMRVPSLWMPGLAPNGLSAYTNECHVPFADPGASASGLPVALAAGYQHSLALRPDGTVIGWGNNLSGQTSIPAAATNVVSIAAGYGHNLALRRDGTVVGWGLGNNNQADTPAGLSGVVAIAAGGFHSLALKSDGTVTGWGANGYGQANGATAGNNVVAIAAGIYHSLALKADGTVVGWGDNSYGQRTTPPGLNTAVAIAAGNYHNVALRSDGTVIAWGDNGWNQTNVPVGLNNVVAIAARYNHSLALKADGTVVVWGANLLGEGVVPAGLANVAAIATGFFHNLALKTDGTIVGWGDNSLGQTSVPGAVYTLSLPLAVNGAPNVDVNGVYTISYTAANSLWAAVTRTVTVVGPPQMTLPVSPWLSAGTDTSAILNGTVNPGGYDTTAWFEWGTTTDYGIRTEAINAGSGPTSVPVWSQLNGLTMGATYHYRLAASNSLGVAYSPDRLSTLRLIANLADRGEGSLRQSVLNANSGDVLFLTNTGTLYLTSGGLVINKDLNILGPGATYLAISGSNSSRVLNIGSNASVTISGVQIQSGRTAAGQPGGGVYNAGLLTLEDCVITNNHAGDGVDGPAEVAGTPGGNGGGIFNSGTLIARRCTICFNSGGNGGNGGWGHDGWDSVGFPEDGHDAADGAGGGDGGGIYSSGPLTLTDCSLFGNAAGIGGSGAAGGQGGDNYTWFPGADGGKGSNGGAGGSGGAIYASNVTSLLQCTISDSRAAKGGEGGASGPGGGGWGGDGTCGSSGDGGAGGSGGGLWVSGSFQLVSCTIASNASGAGASPGIYGPFGGYGSYPGSAGPNGTGGGVMTLSPGSIMNTIVGLNVSSNLLDNDVCGPFVSLGHNLISTATGNPIGYYGLGFTSSLGDLLNVNPGLAPLGDYGGPTFTRALLANSAAVNAGDYGVVSASGTDQRGLPRLVGGAVDIGAYEFQYGPPHIQSISSLPGAIMLLQCTGTSGAAYTLQTSTNLTDWVNLTSMSAGYDGRMEFRVGRTNRAEFFRLKWP